MPVKHIWLFTEPFLSSKVSWFKDKLHGHSKWYPTDYTGKIEVNSPTRSFWQASTPRGILYPLCSQPVPICQKVKINNDDCKLTAIYTTHHNLLSQRETHCLRACPSALPPSLTLPAKRALWFDDAWRQVLNSPWSFDSTFTSSFYLAWLYFMDFTWSHSMNLWVLSSEMKQSILILGYMEKP